MENKEKFEKFIGKPKLRKSILKNVRGGGLPGTGWFRTVSGDCDLSSRNCWHLSTWF
ncbi:hypothetical protein [Tenacibaculum finnmarkense]|uniref:hypothetical protein n=1 Tax=Tenacibaculum finnmarkense TaxID=2781243 RepID=UPI001E4388B5|nr:hypothetical protein [Tenacibaculum finnmarkense]MCD8412515.1 hypothetical protein [Tenacibaculum finnmarkense genomovar ulcerans]MCG8207464.1 hypothetical protein [Tenacibaculum finnmarkense genomovar finnmarkense]MCG8723575.1 hypothetical protein [Tenacibaculum finnmarkense]MCG8741493.1 hypothetical protein [Tenacibaculum finnmarkense]MCG8765225.1 hypothetical protein [Tenacibaculum finnmarkense]